MSVSSLGGSSPWTAAASLSGGVGSSDDGSADGTVVPHYFQPDDPDNKYLTDADRTALRKATGLTIFADGGIASPVSMDAVTAGVATYTAGEIAADRADGRLTGVMTKSYLAAAFKAAEKVVGTSPTGEGPTLDLSF